MAFTNDVIFKAADFQESSVDSSTLTMNGIIEDGAKTAPRWYEMGAAKYREMVYGGRTQFPVPPVLPEAQDATIPSRDVDRKIPIRLYKPDNKEPSKGLYIYFHGGGFCMGSHRDQDQMLKMFANTHQLTAISVGYRLAPEEPFPAGIDDGLDVAEYLVDNGPIEFGAPLSVIGGASAGGSLAAVTTFQLMRKRPQHRLVAVLLINGSFDLTLNMPSTVQGNWAIVIDREVAERFLDAYVPGTDMQARRNPLISPIYEDMPQLAKASPFRTLPPALFTCGTGDAMLDESLLMAVKWMASGSEAVIKLYPGAPHMFSAFKGFKAADDAASEIAAFLNEKLSS